MVDIKEKYWLFPFIGSLLCLIAFIFPSAWAVRQYQGDTIYYNLIWIFSLHADFIFLEDINMYLNINLLILAPSLICSLLIFVFNLVIIRQSHSVLKGKLEMEDVENNWIFLSLFSFIISLIWMILMHIAFIIYYGRTVSFWRYYRLGPGLFLIFIGCFIAVIGILMKKKKYEQLF